MKVVDDLPETFLAEQLVEVGDNLVEQTQTLDAFVVALQLDVELGEIWDAGKQDADRVALLVIQILAEQSNVPNSIKCTVNTARKVSERERESATFDGAKKCVATHVIWPKVVDCTLNVPLATLW